MNISDEEIEKNLNDLRSTTAVLGCLIKKPSLMDEYTISRDDFRTGSFQQIIFACVNNLYKQGYSEITAFDIDSFLSHYEIQYNIFKSNDGLGFIDRAVSVSVIDNFEANLKTIKKYAYLRFLWFNGYDVTSIYDFTITSPAEEEKEKAKFDAMSIEDMIDFVEKNLITEAKVRFISETKYTSCQAGDNLTEQIEQYKEAPNIGAPMQSKLMNTLLHGSRLGCAYLRSGSTGSGKSRLSIADTCSVAIPWFYDLDEKKWKYTGIENPSLIISCELDEKQIKNIILAYVSGVKEDKITDYNYTKDEKERVDQAAIYIKSAPLYIIKIPDFDINDITFLIKKYHREYGVQYVNFDYLHITIKLMAQISSITNGMKLREDQILFMFTDRIKSLTETEHIHIDTSTQLNGTYKDQKYKDQDSLRGAKNMADRMDAAWIAMPPTQVELTAIEPVSRRGIGVEKLTDQNCMVYHVYKVREGKITRVKVFMRCNLGNCRTEDICCTTFDNELIEVEKLTIENIEQVIKENSVSIESLSPEEQDEMKSRWTSDLNF